MNHATDQASDKRRVIAETAAESLLESGQLRALENGLEVHGIILNLPSNPTLDEVANALKFLLEWNPGIVPAETFFSLPPEERAEWATDQLNNAT